MQYDTARNFDKIQISRENETKNETIFTHWPVTQAGSNDEKNCVLKILLDCPFKANIKKKHLMRWKLTLQIFR